MLINEIHACNNSIIIVLAAHNGFMFDFRILSAEVKRWGMMEQFSASTLAYADTYFELKKVF